MFCRLVHIHKLLVPDPELGKARQTNTIAYQMHTQQIQVSYQVALYSNELIQLLEFLDMQMMRFSLDSEQLDF